MKTQRVRALVDRLVARDGCYRPLELLKLCFRLDVRDEQRWLRGEVSCLEDVLAGDPERSAELLRQAAEWARQLELAGERDGAIAPRASRAFRNSLADQAAKTSWRRHSVTPQQDLFFDNSQATARNRLQKALLAGDRSASEKHLAEMVRARPDSQVQADAEHLVGALAWLEQDIDHPEVLFAAIDEDLSHRARRLLGSADAERFLKPLWSRLAEAVQATDFGPKLEHLHPAALHERAGDWQAVIRAVQDCHDHESRPALLVRLARAAFRCSERETGWKALARLCWHDGDAAESFLETTDEDELVQRVEQFWDLDPALPIALFPAWLVSLSFALPELEDDGSRGATALAAVRAVRAGPDQPEVRQRLAELEPDLMQYWLRR